MAPTPSPSRPPPDGDPRAPSGRPGPACRPPTASRRFHGRTLAGGAALLLAATLAACGSQADRTALGPVDGRDLPPVDTGRVAVGDTAPDFALESYEGPVVALSDFRGAREVVLVFYRGHW